MLRGFSNLRQVLGALALAATIALIMAPVSADARSGNGGSFGSRGSRTFSAPAATPTAPRSVSPIERSTASPQAASPGLARAAAPAASRFGGGFIAGLVGAGLLGALFGAGFFGGLGSLTSILGLILQIGLLVLVVRLAFNWFASRRMQPAAAAAGGAPVNGPTSYADPLSRTGSSAPTGPSVAPVIGPDDFNAFEKSLVLVQQASSNEDAGSFRKLATPEMAAYLQEEIDAHIRKGVTNRVGSTKLLQGDLAEAWTEGQVEFATVAMRFSLTDTMVDRSTGKLVSGDPIVPVEAKEVWTFQRPRGGKPGDWVLSAIQQAQ